MDVTNLLADRLMRLGAEVALVRSGDYLIPLEERPFLNRNVKPDMYISIHSNSTTETTNATNIHGLTMWYRNPASKPAADSFMQSLHTINPLTTRRLDSNQANFFVCRPSWAPSLIVEASFMNNIQDFSWLVNSARQDELAWGIVNAILAYYR
jgi:N-acetylmuramoyl-L-alanine amidase